MTNISLSNERQRDRVSVSRQSSIKTLMRMTPQQIDAYIDANVTDLASAKEVMSRLAQVISILARREFRDEWAE